MDSYKLVIPTRFPSYNEYTYANRTNCFVGNKMKCDAQKLVRYEIRSQLKGIHIDVPVMMSYHYFEPNRKRDLDNISNFATKIIQDALVKEGIIDDDSQRYICQFSAVVSVDQKNPRIEVTITPFSEVML